MLHEENMLIESDITHIYIYAFTQYYNENAKTTEVGCTAKITLNHAVYTISTHFLKYSFIEQLLKFFVAIVDAELFKRVELIILF